MGAGSAPSELGPAGALDELARRAKVDFPHLLAARRDTAAAIEAARTALERIAPGDVSVVMFGSWARRELTAGSDNDWAILTPAGRENDADVEELAAVCRARFDTTGKAPGAQDLFGRPFPWPPLSEEIGLEQDTNTNLTRRMLTLYESVALTGPIRDECWQAIVERYLDDRVKDHRPPRFLLNDTVRYWRTICVDFEGKHIEQGGDDPKWVMRNAKLRTSRKMLFAGGLLPILFCRLHERQAIPAFLAEQLAAPPVDRVAWAFLAMDMVDEGARCLLAYDEWVGLLRDETFRSALAALRAATRDAAAEFAQVRAIGDRLHRGLLALLFDSDLGAESRHVLVF